MTITTYKWSIKEWHELIDSGVLRGKSVQLLEGEIITVSPEKPIHSSRIVRVADYLRNALQGHAQIREAHPITLDDSEPELDIAIVRSRDNFYDDHHPYAKDIYWLIEVANKTLKTDMETKSRIYARNNIPEYWIIDLVNKQLIIYTQPQKNGYGKVHSYIGGTISTPLFPNLEIDIDLILQRRN